MKASLKAAFPLSILVQEILYLCRWKAKAYIKRCFQINLDECRCILRCTIPWEQVVRATSVHEYLKTSIWFQTAKWHSPFCICTCSVSLFSKLAALLTVAMEAWVDLVARGIYMYIPYYLIAWLFRAVFGLLWSRNKETRAALWGERFPRRLHRVPYKEVQEPAEAPSRPWASL